MSKRFDVTPAVRADVPDLHALIGALADYERLEKSFVSSEDQLEAALFGPHPAAEALIARESIGSRAAAGYALFFHTYSTFLGRRGLWLEDLFVRPEHRGHGLGRALLATLGRLAHERGCGRFEWAVLDWNAPAIAFYHSLGATVMPDWRIVRVTGAALARLAADAQSQ